jgi:hypothetical protein
MTPSLLTSYCRSHDLTLLDGFNLISSAIKQASNSTNDIIPIEDEKGEISFVTRTQSGEFRPIELKPSLLTKTGKRLESLVQRYQSNKEIDLLRSNKEKSEIVLGTIDERVTNGWFVSLTNIRAFMPIKEAIEGEAKLGLYDIGTALRFEIVSSGKERNGKPRVILSRRNGRLAKSIAEYQFSIYGFVSLKRKAGEKQTIIIRAYPQKQHQAIYQSCFPSERIIYRKMLIDGSIAPIERKARR